MVDAIKYQTLGKFAGVNNVDDATRLAPVTVGHEYVYPLQEALNVDIDNTFRIVSRPGYDDVLSGTNIHSLWSDGVTCLYVDGTELRSLSVSYVSSVLRTGLTTGARMSYVSVNDRIYFTNGYEIGYVKASVAYPLSDPAKEFKELLPPGQFIEYYRGCLYVAKDNVLYISDPLCDYFDVRMGYKLFSKNISLLRAVDDGIYIGDDRIWWVAGDAPEILERKEVYTYHAISYTDVRVNGQNIGEGIKGNVVMWTGENGICLGDNSGVVINLTESRYTFTATKQGAGFIRSDNNVHHYINSLY